MHPKLGKWLKNPINHILFCIVKLFNLLIKRAGILRPTQRTPSPNNYSEHQVQLTTLDTKSNLLRLTLRPTKLSALPEGK